MAKIIKKGFTINLGALDFDRFYEILKIWDAKFLMTSELDNNKVEIIPNTLMMNWNDLKHALAEFLSTIDAYQE